MRTTSKASVAVLGAVVAALALAGCGSTPKPKAQVVDGMTLTLPGTKLTYGQSATVLGRSVLSTSSPATQASSPLTITVRSIKVVPVAQLARYGVAKMKPAVTPYYVYVDVKNAGKHDVGGAAIPLYLQDSKNVLVNYNPIKGKFPTCPSQPLPKSFAAGASVNTCLIYLLPAGDPATLVSYRPIQTVDPITWSGSIAGQSPSASPSK
ncbi:MAG: hypothetical protein ACTHJM_16540 [Marmoricola sp.]